MKFNKRKVVEKKLAHQGLRCFSLILAVSMAMIIFCVLWLSEKYPVFRIIKFVRELVYAAANVLPDNVNGIIAITVGGICLVYGVMKTVQLVLGAYLPSEGGVP